MLSYASLVAQLVKNPPAMHETWVQFLGWEDHLEKERLLTPVFWPGEFHRLYSPWGRKESDKTEQLSLLLLPWCLMGFPGGSDGKESTCNEGDLGSIPGSVRSPGEGNGNPLQCSCLENPRDGGAWWAAVYGVVQSGTRLKRLSSSSSIPVLD